MGIRRIPALISVIPAALVLFGCSGSTSDPADLVRLDENGRPVNWPASKIEYLNERTVAVELRDDFAFHDGEPLTVEDVKFTFNFAKEVNSPTYSAHIRSIASVEITGPNSLVFNLSDSYAPSVWFPKTTVSGIVRRAESIIPRITSLRLTCKYSRQV